jgi:hypothetical protein
MGFMSLVDKDNGYMISKLCIVVVMFSEVILLVSYGLVCCGAGVAQSV